MAKCPECGCKECCGADMAQRIEELESALTLIAWHCRERTTKDSIGKARGIARQAIAPQHVKERTDE